MPKTRVLFLCTGNSVRSQMAEALLRQLGGDRFEVWSAGVAPAGIHPMTVRVLEEEGIDMGNHFSKSIDQIPAEEFDLVITLCGHAKDRCPAFPERVAREHWPIDDPIAMVATAEQRLQMFRETREKIRDRILDFLRRT